jgi:crotonobetainyl-CoA:carnitine CoA-transferase CaiB-like acyl-CoA transferase
MTEKQFSNLMTGLGRPDALADPRFSDWPSRSRNEPELRAIIEEALAADSARNWEKRLTASDVPCAAIWPISEIIRHPQLDHREIMQKVESPYGELRLAGSGFRFEHNGGGIDRPPPLLGEHTEEILTETGYTPTEIAAFREEGVV